jgi:molybdopterin molybdotransferase
MVSFEDARQLILDHIHPLAGEPVDIAESPGRVLAQDVAAPWEMPICDNSAMDGYAVRALDCQPEAELRLVGYVPAGGLAPDAVAPGCAIKVMTGAPVPPGCDAIVPLEEAAELNLNPDKAALKMTSATATAEFKVRIKGRVKAGQHLRFAGEDVRRGEIVMRCGTLIRPPEISMLASAGKLSVMVYRRPQVAILSTGDELIVPGECPTPGKVVDSNSLALAAAVREAGAVPLPLGAARDDEASHRAKISEGLQANALITSAGVSAGQHDLVRDTLLELGVRQLFWRVAISPGGPMAFGTRAGRPVFSLPGNPVAALITFEEFVRPALLKMMGHTRVLKPFITAILQDEVRKKAGKINFLRVALKLVNGRYLAYSAGNQHTGMLTTSLKANALAHLPADRTSFSPGDEVQVHLLSGAEMLI